jgi:16S rRNA (cytidine1402-2'-O)-methyltransferase
MPGTVSLVATPIGNLEDITLRALKTLKEADMIACEDTRVASKLLAGLGLEKKKLIALHEHSDEHKIASLLHDLAQGHDIAYVSDAGTPGVNDPGGKLVQAAFQKGIRVIPIPGPSALTAAISVCGFPMDDFRYLGFVPHKKGRETFFREISAREEASVFFESTHRIAKTIESLRTHLSAERGVFIGRELTKLHETLYRGTIDDVAQNLQATSLKGEFVLIIAPMSFRV